MAIGARNNDGNGNNSGHVRIYENQNSSWVQLGSDINGDANGDYLGNSVSLSSDGSIVAVGATQGVASFDTSGYVRVYKIQNSDWVKLGSDINGETNVNRSGNSVSLSSDGSIVAIGTPLNDGNGNGSNSGHVRVYDLTDILSAEEQVISNFNIYPNPTKNIVTIQLENRSDLKNVNVYNNLGQLVLTSKKTIIDTSKLATGLYVVEIETNKGKGSKKLIIE